MKPAAPKLEQRQIGRVHVFDLSGSLTGEKSFEVIEKIDHTIQKKKLKRVILNLQEVEEVDEIAARKIVASLIRPQKSLIYCANERLSAFFQSGYMSHNVRLCATDAEVADSLGSFLFEKEKDIGIPKEQLENGFKNAYGLERRRKKRIRVAIPIHIEFETKDGKKVFSKAIATNISQGGLYAEYLDLDSSLEVSKLSDLESNKVTVIVPANESFPEELRIPACVKRIELLKRQVGMGIQFV